MLVRMSYAERRLVTVLEIFIIFVAMLGGHVSLSLLSLPFVFLDCLSEISPLHPLTVVHYTGRTLSLYDHPLRLDLPTHNSLGS